MRQVTAIWFLLLTVYLPCSFAEDEAVPETLELPDISHAVFYIGDFRADSTRQNMENPVSDFAMGITIVMPQNSYVDWALDFMMAFSDYDTPASVSGGPFTIISDEMGLSTFGIGLNPRLKLEDADSQFYIGAGAGLYFSRLTLTASTLGFPGSHEERSNNIGLFYNAGLIINITPQDSVGVEYRKLALNGRFAPVTRNRVDIGGEFVFLLYAYKFE